MEDLQEKVAATELRANQSIAIQFLQSASMRAKKDKIVVLSPGGFNDNSKYMFAYLWANIQKFRDDVKPIWYCHNDEEAEAIRNLGGEAVVYKREGSALKVLIEAKICLRSTHHFARPDYCFLQPALAGATNIQMWHGVPAKKIAYQLVENRKSAAAFAFYAADCLASDYVVAESEYVAPRYQEAFPNASLIINGSSRTDCLLEDWSDNPFYYLNVDANIVKAMKKFRKKGGRVALYSPTYREGAQDKTAFLKQVESFLKEASKDENLMVVMKNHKVSKEEEALREIVKSISSKRILMADCKEDIYPYMSDSDVLVTDYSSTYYDYLITGRDIVFFQPDLKEYKSVRKIYDEEELSSTALGVKVFKGVDAAKAIKTPQSKELQANREDIANKIFTYRDGRSSERLAKKIFNELF